MLTAIQIAAILNLLTSFNVPPAEVSQIQTILTTPTLGAVSSQQPTTSAENAAPPSCGKAMCFGYVMGQWTELPTGG